VQRAPPARRTSRPRDRDQLPPGRTSRPGTGPAGPGPDQPPPGQPAAGEPGPGQPAGGRAYQRRSPRPPTVANLLH